MTIRTRFWTPFVLPLLLLSCTSPVGSEASCIALVDIGGTLYGWTGENATPTDVDGHAFATVTTVSDCNDQPDAQGLQGVLTGPQSAPPSLAGTEPASSNFLPLGTTIHRLIVIEPTDQLVFQSPTDGQWDVLSPLPFAAEAEGP